MSINLGTDGCNAAAALRTSEPFEVLVQAIKDQAQKAANATLDAGPEILARQAGYARALRDLYVAVEAARSGLIQQKVKTPGVKE